MSLVETPSGILVPEELRGATDLVALQRQLEFPIDFAGRGMFIGIGRQPSKERLLSEIKNWAAIAAAPIAKRIAALEPIVFVERSDGDGTVVEEQLDDHPLKLLLDNPSPTFSRMHIQWLAAFDILFVGEFYLQKVRDGVGRVVELNPIPPTRVHPIGDMGRIVAYHITDRNGQIFEEPASEIIRVWCPDPENHFGARGVLGPQALAYDAQKFILEHLRSHFEHDATPRVALKGTEERDIDVDDANWKRFQQQWIAQNNRRNGTNVGGPMAIPWGLDIHEFQAHGGVTDLHACLMAFAEMLLSAFGTPASKVGLVKDVNRANAEANDFTFNSETIKPMADQIADAYTRQLAGEFDPQLRVKFEDVIPRDKEFKLKVEDQDLRLKVRAINEIRKERGTEPSTWGEFPVGTVSDTPYRGDEGFPAEDAAALGEEPRLAPSAEEGEAEPGESVEVALVLNGAQVTALVGLVQSVLGGSLPHASALEIMQSAFGMSKEKALAVLGPPSVAGSLAAEEGPRALHQARKQVRLALNAGGENRPGGARIALTESERQAAFQPMSVWERELAAERKFVPKVERALRRVFELQRKDIIRRLREHFAQRGRRQVIDLEEIVDFEQFAQSFDQRVNPLIQESYDDTADANIALLVGGAYVLTEIIGARLTESELERIRLVDQTTRRRLERAVALGLANEEDVEGIVGRINGVMSSRKTQAQTIARTEVGKATQEATLDAFKQSEIVERTQWNTALDLAVRDSHLINGQKVELGQEFTLLPGKVGFSEMTTHPRAGHLSAGNRINCRCFLTPVFETLPAVTETP